MRDQEPEGRLPGQHLALGRGIGSTMTWRPLHDARAQGRDLGVLQAAPEGVRIYHRLGFRAFGDVTEIKPRSIGPAKEVT